MTQIEFVGQSSRDGDFEGGNTGRLVNVYREPIVGGGRAQNALKSVLGLDSFAQLSGVFVRAMAEIDGKLFAVCGGALYEIGSDGTVTTLGAVNDSAETSIAGNNGDVTVAAGGDYYLWDGATLTNPTAGAFSDFGAVDYIGNYTVITEQAGRRFQWSDIADASDLPGLNFSTADGRDDLCVRPFAINGALYIFKETSHEVWYVTGQAAEAAFERQVGGVFDIGLKAFGLICRIPQSAFFVGDDNRAYVVAGGLRPVSTPPVETSLRYDQPECCFMYEDEGHTFCVVTFASRPAWVYDVATGEWHERAAGVALGPWDVTASAKFGGIWYAGRDDGKVLAFARVNADDGHPLVREVTSRTLYQDGQRMRVSEVEVFPRQGRSEGNVMLSVSRDGGNVFGDPKVRAIGPVGNYGNRVIWRNLGQCRQFTARLRWTDTADISFLAEARLS